MKKVGWIFILASVLLAFTAGPLFAAQKPVLGVVEFRNNTSAGWWSGSVGRELADMLTNELMSGGQFKCVERQKLQAVLREQDLGASGRVRQSTAAKVGQMTGAQYLVTGTVSAFEGKTEGTGGGLRIAGFSLGGKKEKAYVAIDLRVVNSTTGEIEYARTVEGKASSGGMSVGAHYWIVGGHLSQYKKTPVGKAIRACLIESVEYLECVMVFQDGCEEEYRGKEQRRRDKTKRSISLDE
ncbi:MAG: CsgG/HfaB family protein [Deltaproteobacteria bacterium]|nr:CsgG/HfaB family protein [Deltaproteobacteria bacterium]